MSKRGGSQMREREVGGRGRKGVKRSRGERGEGTGKTGEKEAEQ